MNQKEKIKRALIRKRRAKLEKELDLIATGAGMWWQEESYWEYQDDSEKCLGQFMGAVSAQYDLPRDDAAFSFWNFAKWSNLRTLAKLIDEQLQWKKQQEKENAA